MRAIWEREMKSSFGSFIIWILAVGVMGLACILMYASMEDSIQEMADSFASMGSFADAFGMNTLSIATLSGYFATEIGTIHGLGSGMFAAAVSITILSKEETGHSAEFLMALPVSRQKVVTAKALTVLAELILFNGLCGLMYAAGFGILREEIMVNEFMTFVAMQLLMNVEIASICFLISAASKDNKLGVGMGAALMLYLYDLMARVVPALEDGAFITPYSFTNGPEIFAGQEMKSTAIILGTIVIILCVTGSYIWYSKRDLKS